MQFSEWEPIYQTILKDMGYDRSEDEMSVRVMKMQLMNSDLMDDEELGTFIKGRVLITGGAVINDLPKADTIIATGSSIPILLSRNIIPTITVTDLDGDVEAQKKASSLGSITIMHAHGDNTDAIMKHAKDFKGKVVMTTQSTPELTVYNFGGFTDGDRAVCLAAHFKAQEIYLSGFDLKEPSIKEGSDPDMKRKKLQWAEKIISLHQNLIINN